MKKNDLVQISVDKEKLEIAEGYEKYLGQIGTILKIQKNMYFDKNDEVEFGSYALVEIQNKEQGRHDNVIFEIKNLRVASI